MEELPTMSFKLSDRVKNAQNNEGTIVRIVPQHNGIDKYMVEFDDANLIPNRMEYSKDQLTLLTEDAGPVGLPFGVKKPRMPEVKKYEPPKCECGVRFVRDGGLHSDWCPLYKRM